MIREHGEFAMQRVIEDKHRHCGGNYTQDSCRLLGAQNCQVCAARTLQKGTTDIFIIC